MFTDADIKASAKVCILGQTVVDNLFPDGSDPIGKVVRFKIGRASCRERV